VVISSTSSSSNVSSFESRHVCQEPSLSVHGFPQFILNDDLKVSWTEAAMIIFESSFIRNFLFKYLQLISITMCVKRDD